MEVNIYSFKFVSGGIPSKETLYKSFIKSLQRLLDSGECDDGVCCLTIHYFPNMDTICISIGDTGLLNINAYSKATNGEFVKYEESDSNISCYFNISSFPCSSLSDGEDYFYSHYDEFVEKIKSLRYDLGNGDKNECEGFDDVG